MKMIVNIFLDSYFPLKIMLKYQNKQTFLFFILSYLIHYYLNQETHSNILLTLQNYRY